MKHSYVNNKNVYDESWTGWTFLYFTNAFISYNYDEVTGYITIKVFALGKSTPFSIKLVAIKTLVSPL